MDLSGNGNNAVPAADANRPQYNATKTAVAFDGVDDFLRVANTDQTAMNSTDSFYAFMVYTYTTGDVYDQTTLFGNYENGTTKTAGIMIKANKSVQFWSRDANSRETFMTEPETMVANEPHLMMAGFDADQNQGIMQFDEKTTTVAWNSPGDINSGQSLIIGGGHLARFIGGDIQELIYVNKHTLTNNEKAAIYHYLAKKWGLTATLDSDGDGFSDDDEQSMGSSPIDATNTPLPDLSDTVDARIGTASGLDSVESNLALWLDATNTNGLNNNGVEDGDAISEWQDLSGNGIHMSQDATGSQPVLTADGINFDLGQHLVNSDINYGLLTSDATVFVVVHPHINNGTIIDQGFYHGGVERGWNLHRGSDWWATTAVAQNSVVWNSHHTNTGYNANHHMYAKSTDGQTPNNQTQIITVLKNNKTVSFLGDGNAMEMADDTLHTGDIDYTSGYQMMIGRTNAKYLGSADNNKDPFDGRMMEIMVFDAVLSSEDVANVWLPAKKWGLTATVDSDGDGAMDANELAAGFDATDANSKPITSDLLMWFPFNGSNESVVGDYKITTLDPAAPDALTYVSDVSQDGTQSLFKYNPYYTNHNVPRTLNGKDVYQLDGSLDLSNYEDFTISFWALANSDVDTNGDGIAEAMVGGSDKYTRLFNIRTDNTIDDNVTIELL